jgi:hypothetical protein
LRHQLGATGCRIRGGGRQVDGNARRKAEAKVVDLAADEQQTKSN